MTHAKQTQRRRRAWLKRAALVALLLVVVFGVRFYQQRNLVGGVAPSIEGTLLNGQPLSSAELRGEPLLVHFWATWCPVCRLEQGTINALHPDYRVLTIAMRSGDAIAVEHYMREQQLGFPVLVDEDGELARRFGVRGVPTSFVLDGQGEIRFTEVGYTTSLGLRLRLWLAARL